FQEKAFDITLLKKLDYILITHEHFDHMQIPAIREMVKKFPKVQIMSNESVKKILEKEGISVSTATTDTITFESVPHEKIVGVEAPENIQFDIFNKLSDPGDSHSFTKTCEVLALPVQAPWGSYTRAIEKVLELKPKVVIPIHDYHWKDEFRMQMYK